MNHSTSQVTNSHPSSKLKLSPSKNLFNSDNESSSICVQSLSSATALYETLTSDESMKYVRESLSTLESAFRLYGWKNVCVAFNGGKDATVVLFLALAALGKYALGKEGGTGSGNAMLHCLYLEGNDNDNFSEVDAFVEQVITANPVLSCVYVQLGIREGIEHFISSRHQTCAFVMGTRRSDPHGASMERFEPSSPDWPPFMRVNPILNWSYTEVWRFLRSFHIPYCQLYERGYTSIGSIITTEPNPALRRVRDGVVTYDPAWVLEDDGLERAGRSKKPS